MFLTDKNTTYLFGCSMLCLERKNPAKKAGLNFIGKNKRGCELLHHIIVTITSSKLIT